MRLEIGESDPFQLLEVIDDNFRFHLNAEVAPALQGAHCLALLCALLAICWMIDAVMGRYTFYF